MTENTVSSPGAASLYAAILDEITSQNWSQTVPMAVDDLGLFMGTHQGLKRKRNEDRLAVARVMAPNLETYTIAIVCDGVGSTDCGDRAASIAVASIVHQLAVQRERMPLVRLATLLARRSDDQIRKELQGRGATTLVMLLATAAGSIVCASVGDSRAYSWDRNAGRLQQVTIDDTIENELREIPGDHRALLQARGLQGRLSQALGELGRDSGELRVQTYTEEHFHSAAVIGSDGLWRVAKDFESIAASTKSASDVVRRAITLANWVGGVDNSSIIAIEDPERFCRPLSDAPAIDRQYAAVSLWASAAKVRILFKDNPSAVGLPPSRIKPARPKKTTKVKSAVRRGNQVQLSLDSDPPSERPKVEMIIGENTKTSK